MAYNHQVRGDISYQVLFLYYHKFEILLEKLLVQQKVMIMAMLV